MSNVASSRFPQWLASVLALMTGAVAAAVIFGRPSESEVRLAEQLEQFESLGDERERIVRAERNFKERTEQNQQELLSVHDYVQANPDVQRKLDDFYSWWESLDTAERQIDTLDASSRTIAMRELFLREGAARSTLSIDFDVRAFYDWQNGRLVTERPQATAGAIPHLNLSYDTYQRVLDQAMAVSSLSPERIQLLGELKRDSDQALQRTVWLIDDISKTDETFEIADRLIDALAAQVTDEAWKKGLLAWHQTVTSEGDEPIRYRINRTVQMLLLLKQAAEQLRNNLQKHIDTDQQRIVDTFAAIQDPTLKRELMTGDPHTARIRLEGLSAGSNESPETRLRMQVEDLDSHRREIMTSVLRKAQKR